MNKTLLVSRHEFLKTLKRKGFIALTLSLPVIALLSIGIYHAATGAPKAPAEVTRVGYVDEAGGFDQFTSQGNTALVRFDTAGEATQAFVNKDIAEYFVIPADLVSRGTVNLYLPQNQLAPSGATAASITNFISSNLLAGRVPADVIARVEAPLNLATTNLTPTGAVAPQQGGYINFIVPGVFSLLLALSLIFSSTYVLQSLGEEKENRLMEILMSSISARQLLSGKVLGLGAAGLVQVIVWVVSMPLLLNLASSSIGGFLTTIQVPAYFWMLGIAYFILGYALFAVLSASIAAVASTVQEAQGLAAIYTLFAIAPFWFTTFLLLYPNSPVWTVFSIFPFSAPVLTMMRLGLVGVPAWQLAASTAALLASVVGGLLLAARLLRVYMLAHGKRPTLGQIVRRLGSGRS